MTPRFELFVVADLLYFERRVMRYFIFQDSKVVNCCILKNILSFSKSDGCNIIQARADSTDR